MPHACLSHSCLCGAEMDWKPVQTVPCSSPFDSLSKLHPLHDPEQKEVRVEDGWTSLGVLIQQSLFILHYMISSVLTDLLSKLEWHTAVLSDVNSSTRILFQSLSRNLLECCCRPCWIKSSLEVQQSIKGINEASHQHKAEFLFLTCEGDRKQLRNIPSNKEDYFSINIYVFPVTKTAGETKVIRAQAAVNNQLLFIYMTSQLYLRCFNWNVISRVNI